MQRTDESKKDGDGDAKARESLAKALANGLNAGQESKRFIAPPLPNKNPPPIPQTPAEIKVNSSSAATVPVADQGKSTAPTDIMQRIRTTSIPTMAPPVIPKLQSVGNLPLKGAAIASVSASEPTHAPSAPADNKTISEIAPPLSFVPQYTFKTCLYPIHFLVPSMISLNHVNDAGELVSEMDYSRYARPNEKLKAYYVSRTPIQDVKADASEKEIVKASFAQSLGSNQWTIHKTVVSTPTSPSREAEIANAMRIKSEVYKLTDNKEVIIQHQLPGKTLKQIIDQDTSFSLIEKIELLEKIYNRVRDLHKYRKKLNKEDGEVESPSAAVGYVHGNLKASHIMISEDSIELISFRLGNDYTPERGQKDMQDLAKIFTQWFGFESGRSTYPKDDPRSILPRYILNPLYANGIPNFAGVIEEVVKLSGKTPAKSVCIINTTEFTMANPVKRTRFVEVARKYDSVMLHRAGLELPVKSTVAVLRALEENKLVIKDNLIITDENATHLDHLLQQCSRPNTSYRFLTSGNIFKKKLSELKIEYESLEIEKSPIVLGTRRVCLIRLDELMKADDLGKANLLAEAAKYDKMVFVRSEEKQVESYELAREFGVKFLQKPGFVCSDMKKLFDSVLPRVSGKGDKEKKNLYVLVTGKGEGLESLPKEGVQVISLGKPNEAGVAKIKRADSSVPVVGKAAGNSVAGVVRRGR